jgi:hypothetical protein
MGGGRRGKLPLLFSECMILQSPQDLSIPHRPRLPILLLWELGFYRNFGRDKDIQTITGGQ